MRFVISVLVLMVWPCQILADSDDAAGSTIPLSKLFPAYEQYLELSAVEQPAILPVYMLASAQVSPDTIELSFDFEGQEFRFTPDPAGRLKFRPTAEMLEADPIVSSNQPKGSLKLSLTLDVVMVGKTRYDVGDLHKQIHTAWGQAKDFGGFMAVFSPKHVSTIVHFPAGCTDKKWSLTKGKETIAEGEGQAEFELDFGNKKIRKADLLLVSCRPERFSFK